MHGAGQSDPRNLLRRGEPSWPAEATTMAINWTNVKGHLDRFQIRTVLLYAKKPMRRPIARHRLDSGSASLERGIGSRDFAGAVS